jgi:hypothetical protein
MADNSGSLFSNFRPAPATAPSAGPAPAPAAPPVDNAKITALEKTVAELKAEIAALKVKPIPPTSAAEAAADKSLAEAQRPDLKTIPEGVAKTLAAHLDKAWDAIEAYKAKSAAQEIKLAGAVRVMEELYSRLTAQEERLKALPSEKALEELRARLAAAENRLDDCAAASELKALGERLAAAEGRVAAAEEVRVAEEVTAMRGQVEKVSAGFEEMQRRFSVYLEEFNAIERECRASLGAVKGFAEKSGKDPALKRLDATFKDSLGLLAAKLAAVEKKIHTALGELTAAHKAQGEYLGAEFDTLRRRVEEDVVRDLAGFADALKASGKEAAWLKEEYQVRIKGQLRDLEARYAAVTAVGKRVEALSSDLKELKIQFK